MSDMSKTKAAVEAFAREHLDGGGSAMVRLPGSARAFRCEDCGANVFTETAPMRFACNGCGARYTGEPRR
jgi:DNA-directed RNA polymerase subunit RPC12/RpoP